MLYMHNRMYLSHKSYTHTTHTHHHTHILTNMDVDQIIKIIEAAKSKPKRNSNSSSSSSKSRPRKSGLESFEERVWIVFILFTCTTYLFLWIFGYDHLIHSEIDLFIKENGNLINHCFPTKIEIEPKSGYYLTIEKREYQVDFRELADLEMEFGLSDMKYDFYQFSVLLKDLNDEMARIKELEGLRAGGSRDTTDADHHTNASMIDTPQISLTRNYKSTILMTEFYAEIIRINFKDYCDKLSDKVIGTLEELKGEIEILKRANHQNLLKKRLKTFKTFQDEFKLILNNLNSKIGEIPIFIAKDEKKKVVGGKSGKYLEFMRTFSKLV